MNKKIILLLVVIIAAIAGFFFLGGKPQNNSPAPEIANTENQPTVKLDPLDANYLVETNLLSLQDGKAESVSPYGAEKTLTEVVGEPVSGDLNSDGQADYAIILKQTTANDPGIYYYVAAALVDEAKKMIVGSNAVPISEGIKIENLSIVNQAVRVSYLERKLDGDNIAKDATVPVTKSYILDGVMFKELTPKRANAQAEAACTDSRGEWNKDENSCKGISKELCEQFGGKTEKDLCKF